MRLTISIALLGAACAPSWRHAPHDARFQRAAPPRLHPLPPHSAMPTDWWDQTLHLAVLPLGRMASPGYYLGRAVEGPPALDVNSFGQVPDSPWFTNRIGKAPMTPADLSRPPSDAARPAPGPLTVVSGKTQGATPGLILRDSGGAIWYVKFDPPAHPHMTTGAEIVAARFLFASGYHVPEMSLVDLDLDRLELSPDATRRDRYNRIVPLEKRDLQVLVTQLNPDSQGRLRALFSRAVPGHHLGPSSYRGLRAGDPNDRFDHRHRRSLRGLWLLSAWLNNTDTRRHNTMDTFISASEDGALGYVRHYLIDFGDALGAAGVREKYVGEGYEHLVDWCEIGKRAIGLGFVYPYWLNVRRTPYRSVGVFEAEVFDPARWSPVYANPAFAAADARDTYWAATILARFTPEMIEAAVEVGEYDEKGAAATIARVLEQRRIKLLRFAFEPVLALDDPVVHANNVVEMTDLEVRARLKPPGRYRWRAEWQRDWARDVELASGVASGPRFDMGEAIRRMTARGGHTSDPFIRLVVRQELDGETSPRVELGLRLVEGHLVPIGLWHEVD